MEKGESKVDVVDVFGEELHCTSFRGDIFEGSEATEEVEERRYDCGHVCQLS